MGRTRGFLDLLCGVLTLQLGGRLPHLQAVWQPRYRRVRRFGTLLRGSSLIMRGIALGLLPNPDGRTAQELEHAAMRMDGWLGISGGCAALWVVVRPPYLWQDINRSLQRGLRLCGLLGGSGVIMQGIADGLMPYPPRWKARALRRVGSILVFASAVLTVAMFIGMIRDIVRVNRQRDATDHPETQ